MEKISTILYDYLRRLSVSVIIQIHLKIYFAIILYAALSSHPTICSLVPHMFALAWHAQYGSQKPQPELFILRTIQSRAMVVVCRTYMSNRLMSICVT